MQDSKETGGRPEGFFAGKGFYIVLFLCAAVIGVSAWSLIRGTGTVEPDMTDVALEQPEDTGEPEPASNYEDVLWEIPEGVQEVLVEAEPPAIVADEPTEPEVVETAATAYIWPIAGELDKPYSVDALMYDATMADWRTHDGVDVAAPIGTKVMAAASGTVTKVYQDELYGATVVIDYGGGVTGTYSNLQDIPTVKEGDAVLAGETIGSVGYTALCESGQQPHLHYSMCLNGQSVDPGEYLPVL